MKSVRNNSAGFSLVELMVVVAIIGILATIAMPQINTFMARARQSEARSALSTIYTTQKAFFAEYRTYFGGLRTVGYVPEGQLRYRVGFGAVGVTPANLISQYGYPGTAANIRQETHSGTVCPVSGTCQELATATAANTTGSAITPTTFTATAHSTDIGLQAEDRWTIDHTKRMLNPNSGI